MPTQSNSAKVLDVGAENVDALYQHLLVSQQDQTKRRCGVKVIMIF